MIAPQSWVKYCPGISVLKLPSHQSCIICFRFLSTTLFGSATANLSQATPTTPLTILYFCVYKLSYIDPIILQFLNPVS